mgnify:CR=1 FL=1
MQVLVIDGQGGNIGSQVIKVLKKECKDLDIYAVGTNSIATANMLKSGALAAATGENSVVVESRKADIIIGPIGIVIADSMMGEVTAKMAVAIAQSNAVRILIPINKCDNRIAGYTNSSLTSLIQDVADKVKELTHQNTRMI